MMAYILSVGNAEQRGGIPAKEFAELRCSVKRYWQESHVRPHNEKETRWQAWQ